MKIAIYVDDLHGANFSGVDISTPYKGNPGIGGTEYEFVMLAYALVTFSDVEVNFYHHNINKLPDGVHDWIIHDNNELIVLVKKHENDILIVRAYGSPYLLEIYEMLRDAGIKCIVWAHNSMSGDFINSLYENPAVKRIVCVSREHYDLYIDSKATAKCTFIYNMFDCKYFKLRELPDNSAVTYTGGLYKDKSFHVFASMWRDILREVPDAKLYVIGSGKLYNHDAELGPLGVADAECEAMFAEYLTENGKLLPSVKLCGNMGIEKAEIYYKTTVGITNFMPETFCISAVEMESCGVPVVNRRIGGVQNTVRHGETGFLGRNYDEIKKYIILLLKDKELNVKMGRQAKIFTENTFIPEKIVHDWLKLFDDVINDRPCEYIKPSENFSVNYKWWRIIKHWLREHHIPVIETWQVKKFAKNNFPCLFYALKKILHRK